MAKSNTGNKGRQARGDRKADKRTEQRANEMASQGFRIYNADGTLAYQSPDKD